MSEGVAGSIVRGEKREMSSREKRDMLTVAGREEGKTFQTFHKV